MRKSLTILLSIISFTLISQVPQGVGYQGVATDANGIELVNQSISIRASILSGSSNGIVQWEETHQTQTDTFGLFSITIGQGVSTTNGIQSNFADISWGANIHFLKIEMDVNGGSNYSYMGTNQMMSVPYALYAESANINYDSISNYLSDDSTFITNVGSGMGGDGCNFKLPDGLNGERIIFDVYSNSYTVPLGKNLYIYNAYTNPTGGTGQPILTVNGKKAVQFYDGYFEKAGLGSPLIAKSGDIIHADNIFQSATVYAILVDSKVEPVIFDVYSNSYTVPSGKNLYIYNAYNNPPGGTGPCILTINGFQISKFQTTQFDYTTRGIPFIANSGDIISADNVFSEANIFAYLADENYFAGCGGVGGGSSSVTIDYDSLANLISSDSSFLTNVGGGIGSDGCNFQYPEGFDADIITYELSNWNDYVVPSGKNLYITNVYMCGNSYGLAWLDVNNIPVYASDAFDCDENQLNNPILVGANDIVSSNTGGTCVISGFLIDEVITPLTVDLLSSNYTVPSGKKLYILNVLKEGGGSWSTISVDNMSVFSGGVGDPNVLGHILPVSGNSIITQNNSLKASINGYLVDENYFAGCGGVGGGSSSATIDYDSLASLISSDSSFITNIGGGIAGGGCNYSFPEGLHGDAITHDLNNFNDYIVPSGKKLYILQHYGNAYDARIRIDGVPIKAGGNTDNYQYTLANPIIASSGQTISCPSNTQSVFNGIIVEDNTNIESITHDLNNFNDYIVPSGKKLYILQHYGNAYDARIRIDGVPIKAGGNTDNYQYTLANPIIASSGQTISCFSNTQSVFNGYLADENFFAGCGNGGSSSASSLDSTAIANMIAAAGGSGCDPQFPDGFEMITAVTSNYGASFPYTVPQNKRLYITAATSAVFINGLSIDVPGGGHILCNAGDIITHSSTHRFSGFLVNPSSSVTAVTSNYGASFPYTVPQNKRLYITAATSAVFINGLSIDVPSGKHILCNAGDIITHSSTHRFSGYLVDENYFANCGGGSSSSSVTISTSNSIGDFSYPDGKENITPFIHNFDINGTYTVPPDKNLYVTSFSSNQIDDELKISTNPVFKGRGQWSTGQLNPVGHFDLPIIAASSELLESDEGFINGFLVDVNVDPVTHTLSGTGSSNGLTTYTVPSGKILVILNFFTYTTSYGELNADGTSLLYGYYNTYAPISGCSPPCQSTSIKNPIFLDENTVLTTGYYARCVFNGYLMDK